MTDIEEKSNEPIELKVADVIVRLKKAGKVTLEELSSLTNDANDKVVSVKHVDRKVKVTWTHPMRTVQNVEPALDDKGEHTADDQGRLLYNVTETQVEDTDPQNIEVRLADGEGEA